MFPVGFLDEKKRQVDADNSPLDIILTDSNGFCGRGQMSPGGPSITDANYSLTLSDGAVVTGVQVKQDIHNWFAVGAPDNGTLPPSVWRCEVINESCWEENR